MRSVDGRRLASANNNSICPRATPTHGAKSARLGSAPLRSTEHRHCFCVEPASGLDRFHFGCERRRRLRKRAPFANNRRLCKRAASVASAPRSLSFVGATQVTNVGRRRHAHWRKRRRSRLADGRSLQSIRRRANWRRRARCQTHTPLGAGGWAWRRAAEGCCAGRRLCFGPNELESAAAAPQDAERA